MAQAVRDVDRTARLSGSRAWKTFVESIRRPRLLAQLIGGFAGLALLLAAVGTDGVLSHMVAERRREIGIRLALGADNSRVMGEIMRQGLVLTAVGLVVGLAGAVGLNRLIASLLFGVQPTDTMTMASVVATITLVAAVACQYPPGARRASIRSWCCGRTDSPWSLVLGPWSNQGPRPKDQGLNGRCEVHGHQGPPHSSSGPRRPLGPSTGLPLGSMHPVDWVIVVAFTAWIVYDGLKRTKDSHEIEGYFLAKRSIPWWAAGISVMATQLSAITMIGTTGQAYADGMRFIQFYFGLPLAMIILSWTLVPFFYNSRVYTARVSREPFRRKDAKLHQPVVPGVARTLGGRGRFGPGRRPVTGIGLEPDGDVAGHHDAGGLYDVRRRASRDLDDIKTMSLIVGGLLVIIATAILGLPDGVSPTVGGRRSDRPTA